MKKFDIKLMLILVLVIVMAFSLVACDKGNGDGGGTGPVVPPADEDTVTASTYFDTLWKAASKIGSTAIDTTDALGIELGASISLATANNDPVSFGIKLKAVLDQSGLNNTEGAHTLGNTAVKIQIVDNATKANVLSIMYFINEADYVYLDVADQQIKVGFDAFWNSSFTTTLGDLLTKNGDSSVMNKINEYTAQFGTDWSLDKLINSVVGEFLPEGKTLGQFINGLTQNADGTTNSIGNILNGLLKDEDGKPMPLVGTDGVLHLGELLKAAGSVLFGDEIPFVENADGTITYTATVGSIVSMVSGMLPAAIKPLLSDFNISLAYTMKGDALDGLSIILADKTAKKTYGGASITIAIDDLKISQVADKAAPTDAETSAYLGVADKTAYKSYLNVDMNLKLDLSTGSVAKINPQNANNASLTIDKDAVISFKGSIDLIGAAAVNKTALELSVKYGEDTILAAVYNSNTLEVQLKNTELVQAIIALIDPDDMYGALRVVSQMASNTKNEANYQDLDRFLNGIINSLFTMTPNSSDGGETGTAEYTATAGATYTYQLGGIDIAKLSRGMFYAMFSAKDEYGLDVAGSEADEMDAYSGEYYTLDGKTYYKDSQFQGIQIFQSIAAAIKLISNKNGTFAITANGLDSTLVSVFGVTSVTPYTKQTDGTFKAGTAKSQTIAKADVYALLFATNSTIIRQFTDAGFLAPYVDGNTSYYMTTKMITKAKAAEIWEIITMDDITAEAAIPTWFQANGAFEKTVEDFNSWKNQLFPNWLVPLFKGSSFLGEDATGESLIKTVLGASVKLSFNKTSGLSIELGLGDNFSATLSGNATITGTNDKATVTTLTGAPDVNVTLDDMFYFIFGAQNGEYGDENGDNGYYYVMDTVPTFVDGIFLSMGNNTGKFVALTDKVNGTCFLVDTSGVNNTKTEYKYTLADGVLTLKTNDEAATTVAVYNVYGHYSPVIVAQAQ